MQDLCYIMWDLSWLLPGLTALWQVGSWFPDQGSNIRSPAFQIGFFTTGLPGKSLCVFSFCTQRNVLIVDLLFLTCELLLKFTLIPNIKKKSIQSVTLRSGSPRKGAYQNLLTYSLCSKPGLPLTGHLSLAFPLTSASLSLLKYKLGITVVPISRIL